MAPVSPATSQPAVSGVISRRGDQRPAALPYDATEQFPPFTDSPLAPLADPAPPDEEAPTARRPRLDAGSALWVVLVVALILLLGGFAGGVAFVTRNYAGSKSLVGAVSASRIGASFIAVAVVCAAMALLLVGRRSAGLAALGTIGGAMAIGAGSLLDLDLPRSLVPKVPQGVADGLVTVAVRFDQRIDRVAVLFGTAALVLVVCLYLLMVPARTARRTLRVRSAVHIVVPIAVLVAAVGGAFAALSPGAHGDALSRSEAPDDTAPLTVPTSQPPRTAAPSQPLRTVPASQPPSTVSPGQQRTNVWIAQLASVAYSEGDAALAQAGREVWAQVPEAKLLRSDDFGSYTPGYWVYYYDGGFDTGYAVLGFCDSRGRRTRHDCTGHFLTQKAREHTPICLRNDAGTYSEDCSSTRESLS